MIFKIWIDDKFEHFKVHLIVPIIASAHKVEVSTPKGTPLPQFYGHYFCDSLAIL